MDKTSNPDAVRRARAGDREAFAVLVERHGTELYRLAAGIVGAREAGDLAQESLVAAWQQLPSLRDADAFAPWLRRICVNRCRNVLRQRGRRVREVELLASVDPVAPGDFREDVHTRDALDGAFAGLSVEQRALLTLHYGLGHSIRETADVLGLREGTCKSRLHAALSALRAVVVIEEVPA